MLKKRSGYWHADITLPGGGRIRCSTGIRVGDDKALAWEEHERLARGPALLARAGKDGRLTLQQAFDRALTEHERWRSSSSQRTITGNFKFVSAHFGTDRTLASISDQDVSDYKTLMIRESKSPSTINQRLSMLSVLFNIAGEIDRRLDKPRIKRAKSRRGRIRILSRTEEEAAFTTLAASTDPRQQMLAVMCAALLDTGFRLSEMLRVGPNEVNFERNEIAAWETKADLPRIITMTSRVRTIMEKQLAGLKASDVTARAFPMFTVFSADHAWAKMRKAIGLAHDKEFVIHALRHTCCSRLVAAEQNAFKVQKWMGHKSITTTMIYVTLFSSDLKGLASALECAQPCAQPAEIQSVQQEVKAVTPEERAVERSDVNQ